MIDRTRVRIFDLHSYRGTKRGHRLRTEEEPALHGGQQGFQWAKVVKEPAARID